MWSHGVRFSSDGQAIMVRLDKRETYFDVIVWGDQPHLLLDLLQREISIFLTNHFPGFDRDTIQTRYICPRCLQELGFVGTTMDKVGVFTTEQLSNHDHQVHCKRGHDGVLTVEEVMSGRKGEYDLTNLNTVG